MSQCYTTEHESCKLFVAASESDLRDCEFCRVTVLERFLKSGYTRAVGTSETNRR